MIYRSKNLVILSSYTLVVLQKVWLLNHYIECTAEPSEYELIFWFLLCAVWFLCWLVEQTIRSDIIWFIHLRLFSHELRIFMIQIVLPSSAQRRFWKPFYLILFLLNGTPASEWNILDLMFQYDFNCKISDPVIQINIWGTGFNTWWAHLFYDQHFIRANPSQQKSLNPVHPVKSVFTFFLSTVTLILQHQCK